MLTHKNRARLGLLGALLAATLLASLFSLTVFAETGETESLSLESVTDTESLPAGHPTDSDIPLPEENPTGNDAAEGEETFESLPQSSIVEDSLPESSLPETETEATRMPQAAPVPMAAPVGVSDENGFLAALDAAVLAGEVHILLQSSLALSATAVVPATVDLTVSGLTGSEVLSLSTSTANVRHFEVYGSLTLENINLYGAQVNGGVYVEGGVFTMLGGAKIYDCLLDADSLVQPDPRRLSGGGVMLASGAEMLLDGGEIYANRVEGSGSITLRGGAGVAVAENSRLTMNSGAIYDNQVGALAGGSYYGGGIWMASSTFVMQGGEIYNNYAVYGGGIAGVNSSDNTIELRGGSVHSNTAGYGGGVYLNSGSLLEIYGGGELRANRGYYQGGGVYMVNSGSLDMQGGKITGNRVTGTTAQPTRDNFGGGAIFYNAMSGTLNISGGEISYNSSVCHGGALRLNAAGSNAVNIQNTRFVGNNAGWDGGAIYLTSTAHYPLLRVQNTYFYSNYAGNGGKYFDYLNHSEYAAWHSTYIQVTSLSAPFDHTLADTTGRNKAYNNFDISYLAGTEFLTYHKVEFYIGNTTWITTAALDGEPVDDPTAQYTPPAGFALDGWYTDATCTLPWGFDTGITSDTQLYARLVPASTVAESNVVYYNNHDPNDQSIYLTTEDVEEGAFLTAPAKPSRTGYTFLGWGEKRATTVFWRFDTHATPDPMPATELHLFAQWRINTHTVTFDYSSVANGPNNFDTANADYGELLIAPSSNVSGYTFVGWRYNGRYWDFALDRMPDHDITLVGVWTQDASTPSSEAPASSSFSTPGPSPDPSPNPGPNPDPGPGPSPTPSSSSSSSSSPSSTSVLRRSSTTSTAPSSEAAVAAESSSSSVATPPAGSVGAAASEVPEQSELDMRQLADGEIPLNWWQRADGWSLVNLLAALVLLASGIFQTVRTLRRRQGGLPAILAIATGVVPALLVPLFESFSGSVLILDKWSPLFLAIAAVHSVLTFLSVGGKTRWNRTE